MTSTPTATTSLQYVDATPVAGLIVAERRVEHPEATLICIHGGLDRGGSFGRLSRRLERFDVVAYDRRGYQRSRGLAPLSLAHHVDDLVALARREALKGPVLFFGHSYGGVVALGAALAEPSSVQLVISYESPFPWIRARESGRPPLSEDAAQESEIFFKRMVSKGAWERLSESERESRRLDGPALLSDISILTQEAPFDVSALKVPTVFVHGDGPLVDYHRALSADLEALNPLISTRELKNAAHGAHLSSPDQLASLITQLWVEQCESE
jgi:pimeloyl-ACP methyl ester carboxylesterase